MRYSLIAKFFSLHRQRYLFGDYAELLIELGFNEKTAAFLQSRAIEESPLWSSEGLIRCVRLEA